MTSEATSSTLPEATRAGAGKCRRCVVVPAPWDPVDLVGMYVLSYRVGSLAAVAAFVGVAFLFSRISQLRAASRVRSWRGLNIISGNPLGGGGDRQPCSGRDTRLDVASILVAGGRTLCRIIDLVDAR